MRSSSDVVLVLRDLQETREVLVDRARRSFGSIPAEELIEHIIAMTDGADFSVRIAAVEALERRWRFAVRDGLTVASRPTRGVFGPYTTTRSKERNSKGSGRRRRKGQSRPYGTVLERIEPICASCDCADFLRSSLGICKHLLVVLDDIFSSKMRRTLALSKQPSGVRSWRLTWDPRCPLTGEYDRLLGLRLEEPRNGTRRSSAGIERVRQLFLNERLDHRSVGTLASRREALAAIHAAMSGGKAKSEVDVAPAARAIISEEFVRAERRAQNVDAAPRTLRHSKTLRRTLYPYQVEGLTRFLESGRLLLADDMGLGKTTQAIAACHVLFEAGRVRRGVLVVPASLKSQWRREWEQTSRVPCSVVDGRRHERAGQYERMRSGFVIVGYEQLVRDIEHIQRLKPELVVLDEAQRIKNYATKSAVYVKSLQPEFRLVLTGTPMENRLEELASILDWIDDSALAPKWRLVPWHTVWTGDGGKSGKAGARNLDMLRARLAPSVLRRVRKEVLKQLPPRTDTRVPVEMTPQQRGEHDELNDPIARLISTSKRRPLTQPEFLRLMALLTKQRIISNGLGQLRFEDMWLTYKDARPDTALLEGLFAPKLLELRRLITDLVLDQGRKVVVFSQWRRMLRLSEWSLRDLLEQTGVRAVFFTGAERPSQRTRSIVDFHDEPDVRILFLSDAGGVGLNLQRAANACINLELPWNPAVLEQRIGRIYRLGQKDPIDVYSFVMEYGIEARIANVIGTKHALFSGLFDGTSDQIQFQSGASFLNGIEQLVEIDNVPKAPSAPVDGDDRSDGEELDAPEASLLEDVRDAESAVMDDLPLPTGTEGSDAVNRGAERDDLGTDRERKSRAPRVYESPSALFESLHVVRTAEGGVRIEAPPEAAESLMQLFVGMARLLEGGLGHG